MVCYLLVNSMLCGFVFFGNYYEKNYRDVIILLHLYWNKEFFEFYRED